MRPILRVAASALCLLAACDSSPTDPTGAAGQYALVEFGGQSIPMQLRRPQGWVGLYCSDLVQSQVLGLRRDRTASLLTRTSYQCEDGRTPVPDSSLFVGSYTASADSVIATFPLDGSPGDSIPWRMSRSGDRLIYSLGPAYAEDGTATADTFRLVYQRYR